MPFALIIVGIVLVTAGVRNTTSDLFTLVKGDFSTANGQESFLSWLVAILIVGSLGYIEELKPLSRAFLVLLIVVLFLSNGGFFDKFNRQLFNRA
jgi:hypothetical protein